MELQFVDWLEREFGSHGSLEVGIGDDAALLARFGDQFSVATHDTLIDGVHFDLGQHNSALIGRKALAVNLSDLAAMAAQPVAILVGLVLPKGHGLELAKKLFLGMRPLLEEFDIAVAGGDTNTSHGPLTIGITAIGRRSSAKNWLRTAAQVGDQLIVTGELGGSILGKHLNFTPKVSEAIALSQRHQINAAIDISDGLLLDLNRICLASKVGARLDLDRIPVSIDATRIANEAVDSDDTRTALDHALSDGEDFELLLSVTPETWQAIQDDRTIAFSLTRIGEIVSERGMTGSTGDGNSIPLEPRLCS